MALATYVNTTPADDTEPRNDDSLDLLRQLQIMGEQYMDTTQVGAPTEPSNDAKPPFLDITEDSPKTNNACMEESRTGNLILCSML